MTDANAPVEKAGLSVFSLILMIIAVLGFAFYLADDWLHILVVPYNFIFAGIILAIAVVSAIISESLRKKGLGIKGVNTAMTYLSWGFIALLIVKIILRFVIPTGA